MRHHMKAPINIFSFNPQKNSARKGLWFSLLQTHQIRHREVQSVARRPTRGTTHGTLPWHMVELGFGSSSRTCSLYFCFQLNAGVLPNHEILSLSS